MMPKLVDVNHTKQNNENTINFISYTTDITMFIVEILFKSILYSKKKKIVTIYERKLLKVFYIKLVDRLNSQSLLKSGSYGFHC